MGSTIKYAELQCKTNYSFLQGASHPEEIIETAAKLGLEAIAITDFNGFYGIPKAFHHSKKFRNLKLITGVELQFLDHPNITLLAGSRQSYGLLCRILTTAHLNGEKGNPSLTWEAFFQKISESDFKEKVVAIPQVCQETKYSEIQSLFKNTYLPISRHLTGTDPREVQATKFFSNKFKIPIVATNDCYFHVASQKILQDILTAIRIGKPLKECGFSLFSNAERRIKSPQEMATLFEKNPEYLERTLEIAHFCQFSPSELRYRYPNEWIPREQTAYSYLNELTWKGAMHRYPKGIPLGVKKQIQHELDLIKKLEFEDYFLTIFDVVKFAKEKEILCQGRGSAANSIVCYCLGITAIDPVQMNLLFERFISSERGEPPDIDIDFEHERREEVIQYIYEKYGRDRSAMLSAVITYKTKSALREVSKVFGIEVGTLSSKKLSQKLEESTYQKVRHYGDQIYGFPRHLSIHSGGFLLSSEPIIDIVPIEKATMEGRTIIQWDKYDLDYLGLLKVDLLSLGILSALRKTLDAIGMKLHEIPHDDPKTYQMIQRADTIGTFQIESRAQMNMLGRLLPKNFYDLVIEVAIVRPGPIQGKMVHPYLKRRRGQEAVTYPHPKLKKILGKTLGVPLFQEQVMKIAVELADFSAGEADELRRAIGGWRSNGALKEVGQKLMSGLKKNGLSEEFAEQIFNQIKGFAQYGFPESHAASFALLAYASSYLKCHHPAEFTAALINSQPMGFYANHTLIDDAKRHGVRVYPVYPNQSEWDCISKKNEIVLGWRVVNGISKKEAESIVKERQKAPFRNLDDFLFRTRLRKNVLQRLAMGGVFQSFGYQRREAFWNILTYQIEKSAGVQLQFAPILGGQKTGLFSTHSHYEEICEDYQSFSLSSIAHPMSTLRDLENIPKENTASARRYFTGKRVSVAGLILIRQRPPTAKGVTFSVLEDEYGFLDLVLHAKVFKRFKNIFLNHCFLIVTGTLQRDTHSLSLLVQSIKPIWSDDEDQLNIEPTQYFSSFR